MTHPHRILLVQLSDTFLNVMDNLLSVEDEDLIDSNNEGKTSGRYIYRK